ncbi:MAG: hypothetical protein QGI34_13685 [Candidatus Latescibacteria bacterium]|nr:hypothetical protein [Candidatus Latescibacterota bacterium]
MRDTGPARAGEGKDRGAYKRKTQRPPVGPAVVQGRTHQEPERGAQRCDLRKREIDEDHPALDNMDTQIGMDTRQNKAGDKRRRQ